MVLEALIHAEKKADEKRIPGWIREPKEKELAGTLEAVARNRFLVDVVGAMATFDALDPRVRDQAEEKEAAASFFADKYLPPLLTKHRFVKEDSNSQRPSDQKTASLFFESGSTVAYVANVVGERLREQREELRISTNNVLAYLIFWLVHRIRCSLFPWGSPEKLYGAVFGPEDELVVPRGPTFPQGHLLEADNQAITLLCSSYYSPSKWEQPALLLGALSGLQLKRDPRIANCLGPHVGSIRNKVFKRFMYQTKLPVMLFLTANKINGEVNDKRCHFILDREGSGGLTWEEFILSRPVAFCVGCQNSPDKIDPAVAAFESLNFSILRGEHLPTTTHTAFIARNQTFIRTFEAGMDVR